MTNEEKIDMLCRLRSDITVFIPRFKHQYCATLNEIIEELKQQPKTGQWLDKKMTIKGGHGLAYGRYGCSVCKKKQPSKTDFCPCCGADMRESEDEQ